MSWLGFSVLVAWRLVLVANWSPAVENLEVEISFSTRNIALCFTQRLICQQNEKAIIMLM